jgi:hypothetical protein
VSGNALFAAYELKFKTGASTFLDTNAPAIFSLSPTNGAVIAGGFAISGAATDNIAVAKVEIQFDNGAWQTASGTSTWNLNVNSSNFLNGPHLLSVRATDAAGNISPTNTASVKFFNVPGNYLQRISGGNPANVTNCDGNIWLADTTYILGAFGYVAGTSGYVTNTVSGVCTGAQPLYQREHYSTSSGGFFYEFDCPAGIYETTLLEAETYWSAAGKRVFNAYIQGRQVLTNFDIFAAAGGQNIPLSRVFTNAVTNAQLQILFTPVVDNARVSGVQVRKIADVFSDSDGIPDWWRLAYFGHALGSAADLSRGSDDADGDGVSNLTEYLHGTNPLNSSSFPTLPPFNLGGAAMSGGNFQFNFNSTTNWTYQLQRRDTLDASSVWTDIGAPVAGTGGVLIFSDGATDNTRFYRVKAR